MKRGAAALALVLSLLPIPPRAQYGWTDPAAGGATAQAMAASRGQTPPPPVASAEPDRTSTTDAESLVEVVRHLVKDKEQPPFSYEPDSQWQKLHQQFVDAFHKALAVTNDVSLVQQLYDIAASDVGKEPDPSLPGEVPTWSIRLPRYRHSDLVLEAARKASSISKRPNRQLYSNLARALYANYELPREASIQNPTWGDSPPLKEAEEAASRAVELGLGRNFDDLLLLGDIHQRAASLLEDVLSVHGFSDGDHQAAYSAYRKAESLTTSGTAQAFAAHVSLFEASRALGRRAEADQWFGKAKLEPGINAPLWVQYASLLLATDRRGDSALAYLEAYRLTSASSMAPNSYEYLCEAGEIYFSARLIDNALATTRRCIEAATSKVGSEAKIASAHITLAMIFNRRGLYEEQVSHAKQAIQLDPSAFAHYLLAEGLNGLMRFTEAVNEAKTALRLSDGKDFLYHFELGSAYFGLQQWPEARQAFQKAAEIEPKDAAAAYNVAVSFYNAQYYEDALTWYREVLKRDPNYPNRQQVQRMINTLSRR
jgi:tetratricopeptide (TPR) repeat protein